MRGIVRAAAYVPIGSDGSRRLAGPDEDIFTLAATALERLLDDEGAGPYTLLLVAGDFSSADEANLARFLGGTVPIERSGTGAEGTARAVASALGPGKGDGAVALVATDLFRAVDPEAASDQPTPSDGAVALVVGPGGVRPADLRLEAGRGLAASSTQALATVLAEAPWAGSVARVGDWAIDPKQGPPARVHPEGATSPSLPVSQGAYVPWATYLADIPSRWRFAAERCPTCGATTIPMRGRCRGCGSTGPLELVHLPRDGGEVVASTVIGPGGQPTEFDDQVSESGPYGVVMVELAPGARVTLQVTDSGAERWPVGSRAGSRLRRLYRMEGEWRYGRKAVPLR